MNLDNISKHKNRMTMISPNKKISDPLPYLQQATHKKGIIFWAYT